MVREGDKTYQVILSDLFGFGLFDCFFVYDDRIIALEYIFSMICVCFEKLKIARFSRFLVVFGRKRVLLEKLRRTHLCHIVCYHLLSIYKKMPRFHSFLSHLKGFIACLKFKVPSWLPLEWNNEFLTCSTPLNVVYHCPHPFRWAYCCPSLHTIQQRTIILLGNKEGKKNKT